MAAKGPVKKGWASFCWLASFQTRTVHRSFLILPVLKRLNGNRKWIAFFLLTSKRSFYGQGLRLSFLFDPTWEADLCCLRGLPFCRTRWHSQPGWSLEDCSFFLLVLQVHQRQPPDKWAFSLLAGVTKSIRNLGKDASVWVLLGPTFLDNSYTDKWCYKSCLCLST